MDLAEIKSLTVEAAQLPIFWQFLGLGGKNYGILEKLDTMSGRVVDNCGFFAVDTCMISPSKSCTTGNCRSFRIG